MLVRLSQTTEYLFVRLSQTTEYLFFLLFFFVYGDIGLDVRMSPTNYC